jgi:hypothetical protein
MVELVTVETLTSSLVHPRETFRRAVIAGSNSIIIAHNHPSGDVDPSDEDMKVTKVMFEAGNLLGITMVDHIIFTKDNYFSFRNNGKWAGERIAGWSASRLWGIREWDWAIRDNRFSDFSLPLQRARIPSDPARMFSAWAWSVQVGSTFHHWVSSL